MIHPRTEYMLNETTKDAMALENKEHRAHIFRAIAVARALLDAIKDLKVDDKPIAPLELVQAIPSLWLNEAFQMFGTSDIERLINSAVGTVEWLKIAVVSENQRSPWLIDDSQIAEQKAAKILVPGRA